MVNMAMSTIMEKTVGEITLISNPMLRMTNSIRPRVFISTPNPAPSRQDIPATRAAIMDPPSFPAIATRMISAQQNHMAGPLTRLMLVRSPVKAKNTGSKKNNRSRFQLARKITHKSTILGHDRTHEERTEKDMNAQPLCYESGKENQEDDQCNQVSLR